MSRVLQDELGMKESVTVSLGCRFLFIQPVRPSPERSRMGNLQLQLHLGKPSLRAWPSPAWQQCGFSRWGMLSFQNPSNEAIPKPLIPFPLSIQEKIIFKNSPKNACQVPN